MGLCIGGVAGLLVNILPQTSSSQFFELSMTVSALTVATLPPADPFVTRLSKSTPPSTLTPFAPCAAVAERSSIRCESRRYWSCSRSTRSPNLRITSMKRLNCETVSKGPIDIAHNCGKTRVATASRSTFMPVASCTASVAIVTAGSFVLIFDSNGTSF